MSQKSRATHLCTPRSRSTCLRPLVSCSEALSTPWCKFNGISDNHVPLPPGIAATLLASFPHHLRARCYVGGAARYMSKISHPRPHLHASGPSAVALTCLQTPTMAQSVAPQQCTPIALVALLCHRHAREAHLLHLSDFSPSPVEPVANSRTRLMTKSFLNTSGRRLDCKRSSRPDGPRRSTSHVMQRCGSKPAKNKLDH